jgi:hypothetical protein
MFKTKCENVNHLIYSQVVLVFFKRRLELFDRDEINKK